MNRLKIFANLLDNVHFVSTFFLRKQKLSENWIEVSSGIMLVCL